MASLPEDRVNPSKPPFSYVGVDCFGPLEQHGKAVRSPIHLLIDSGDSHRGCVQLRHRLFHQRVQKIHCKKG